MPLRVDGVPDDVLRGRATAPSKSLSKSTPTTDSYSAGTLLTVGSKQTEAQARIVDECLEGELELGRAGSAAALARVPARYRVHAKGEAEDSPAVHESQDRGTYASLG